MRTDNNSSYQACSNKLDEIELALNQIDAGVIERLAGELNQCIDLLQPMDADRGDSQKQSDDLQKQERLAVSRDAYESLLRRNLLLTDRVQSIMALQRSELDKLKLGRETAKGYAACRPARTGALINSSN